MTTPHYIDVRKAYDFTKWDKTAFNNFFADLSVLDWKEFLEDVITGNSRAYYVIPERQDGSIVPSVAILLREMPAGLVGERAARSLVTILREALTNEGTIGVDTENFVTCAIRLASNLPTQDVIDVLTAIVSSKSIPESVRVLAAGTLAMPQFMQQLHESFWSGINLRSDPFLLPAVILAIQYRNAKKALALASSIETISDTIVLDYPLRMTLRSLAHQHQNHNEILDEIIKEAPSWLRRQLSRVLDFSEFTYLREQHRHITRDWVSRVGYEELAEMLAVSTDDVEFSKNLEFRCVLGNYLLSGISIAKCVGLTELARCADMYKVPGDRSNMQEAFLPPWQTDLFRNMHRRVSELATRLGCRRPILKVIPSFEDNFQKMSRDYETILHRYFLAEPWFNDRAVRANNREVVQFGVVKEMVAIADCSTTGSMIDNDPLLVDVFSPDSTLKPLAFSEFLDHCRNMQLTVCTPRHHAADNVVVGSQTAIEFPRHLTKRRDTVREMAGFINEDVQRRILLCDVGVAYQILNMLTRTNSAYPNTRSVRGIRVLYPRPLPVGFVYSKHPLWSWCGGLIQESLNDVIKNAIGEVQISLQITKELMHVLRIDCDWPTTNNAERTVHESTT